MSFYFYFFFCLLAYRTHQAVQPLGATSVKRLVKRLRRHRNQLFTFLDHNA
jgi:hypothetical protein